MNSRWLRIVMTLAGWLHAQGTRAEVALPGATLSVQNPSSMRECIDEARLSARVRGQLSVESVERPSAAPLRVEVRVERRLSGLVAELRVSGSTSGIRQIDTARCDSLTDALAVTIAMVLDQEQRDRQSVTALQTEAAAGESPVTTASDQMPQKIPEPAKPKRPTEPPPRPPAVVEQTESTVSPELRTSPLIRLEWRTSLEGGFGVAPSGLGGWMLGLGGGLYAWNWGLRAGGFWLPQREETLGVGSRLLSHTVGAAIEGCRRHGEQWRWDFCLRGTVGAESVQAQGSGLVAAGANTITALHVGPSLGIETGTQWTAGVALMALAPALYRSAFVLRDSRREQVATLVEDWVTFWLVVRVALTTR